MRRSVLLGVVVQLVLAWPACAPSASRFLPRDVRSSSPPIDREMAREHCDLQPARPAASPRSPGNAVPPAEALGHRVLPWPGPRLPRSLRRSGPHGVSLERRFSGAVEERMLERAESLYPPRELVMRAHWCCRSRSAVELRYCGGLPHRSIRDPWWNDEVDGTRVPFAITAEAVRYYLEHRPPFGRGRSAFTYRAAIERHERYVHPGHRLSDIRRFDDVYVVRLALEWSSPEVLIHATRTVVLQATTGAPLGVFGDGESWTIIV